MSTSAVVVTTGAVKYIQDVAIGPHGMHVDEPETAGGRDAGPSPYELLLAALGTCTASTVSRCTPTVGNGICAASTRAYRMQGIVRMIARNALLHLRGWIESICSSPWRAICRTNSGAAWST
jgi:hypothetical protein